MTDATLEFLEGVSHMMEQWARKNHPWQNQTGDAERGLIGMAVKEGDKASAIIGHTVEYGPALEEKADGIYGVIQPTLDHFTPEIEKGLARVLEAFFNE